MREDHRGFQSANSFSASHYENRVCLDTEGGTTFVLTVPQAKKLSAELRRATDLAEQHTMQQTRVADAQLAAQEKRLEKELQDVRERLKKG